MASKGGSAVCIFASEIAALIGRSRYKSAEDAMIAAMNRNKLNHPLGKEAKDKEARLTAVVKHVEERVSAPPPPSIIASVAAEHKIDAAVLEAAVKSTTDDLSHITAEATRVVKELIKKEALTQIGLEYSVPEREAAEAVRSKEACDHGIKNEDTTRVLYNHRHSGNARHHQKAVKQTFITPHGHEYVIFGRLDACEVDCVIECKNRTRRLFQCVPDYELPQLYAYMALTSLKRARQVEQYRSEIMVHEIEFDEKEWVTILTAIDKVVDTMHDIDKAERLSN